MLLSLADEGHPIMVGRRLGFPSAPPGMTRARDLRGFTSAFLLSHVA